MRLYSSCCRGDSASVQEARCACVWPTGTAPALANCRETNDLRQRELQSQVLQVPQWNTRANLESRASNVTRFCFPRTPYQCHGKACLACNLLLNLPVKRSPYFEIE